MGTSVMANRFEILDDIELQLAVERRPGGMGDVIQVKGVPVSA
jgi:hypothetical protein